MCSNLFESIITFVIGEHLSFHLICVSLIHNSAVAQHPLHAWLTLAHYRIYLLRFWFKFLAPIHDDERTVRSDSTRGF